MRLAAGLRAGMAFVQMRLINDLQMLRRIGLAQFLFYSCVNLRHIKRPYGSIGGLAVWL
jgi:hypothetical protein